MRAVNGILCCLPLLAYWATGTKRQQSHLPSLIEFGRESHVTGAALSRILQKVRDEGLPTALSESTLSRQRDLITTESSTPYGALVTQTRLPAIGGGDIVVPMLNPFAMLHWLLERVPAFRPSFTSALDKAGLGSPLDLVIYSDEVTPGAVLSGRRARKTQCLYWTFLQFGASALSNEHAWFTATTMRAGEVEKIDGGMSAIWRAILRLFFGGPGQTDFRDGVHLPIGLHASSIVFAKLSYWMSG